MNRIEGWGGNGVALIAALALAGCSTTQPVTRIETRTVEVPVARSCVPDSLPAAPDYSVSRTDIANAPSAEDRYRLTAVFGLERDARLTEVEPVLAACRD